MSNDKYMTLYEVKAYTTLSYDTIKRAVELKQLKSAFVRNKHIFKKEWVDKWLGGNDE